MISWGFEYGIGGNKNGTGSFIDRLTAAGIPVCFKGTDDAGLCYQAQETAHPDSVLVYRVTTTGQNDGNDYDVPRYELPPSEAASSHWQMTRAKWPPELLPSRVWMEPINEPRAKPDANKPNYNNMHPCDWLGEFMTEYAILANAAGFKACGPTFNSGEPEPEDYSQLGMLRWLRYCADNPTQAALSVHEYNFGSVPYADNYPWHYGRFQAAIAAADLAGIPRTFSIFVTEFGWTLNTVPNWETAVNTIAEYSLLSARFPQLEAAAIWSLRAGWSGISDQLAQYISNDGNPFTNWIINNQYPDEIQPQATAVEFGGTLPEQPEEPPNAGNMATYKWKGLIHEGTLIIPDGATHIRIAQLGKAELFINDVRVPIEPGFKRLRVMFEEEEQEEPENPNPPPVALTLPQGSKGVDVSAYQKWFWTVVDVADVDFCYFRVSDGMNTNATSDYHDANGIDLEFWNNVQVMAASGKPWCIYHFLRPSDIQGQADKVLGIMQQLRDLGTPPRTAVFDDGKKLPDVLLDVEDANLTNAQVKQFRDLIREG